jgi:hypothetical protein
MRAFGTFAFVVLVLTAAAARAASTEVPLAIAAFGTDVVAVGEITSESPMTKVDGLALPGEGKPYPMDVVVFEMKVSKFLKDGRKAATSGPATASAPAGDKLRLLVMQTHEGDGKGLWSAAGRMPLEKGKKFIVSAFVLPGREELYVPYFGGYRLEATDDAVKDVQAALDTDKWAWGKASGGLQLAVLAPTDMQASYPPIMVVKGVKGLNNSILTSYALRNASDKPVTIPLKQMLASMELTATGGGTTAAANAWWDASPRGTEVAEKLEVPAGAVILLGPKGPTRLAGNTVIIMQYGSVYFRATMSAENDAATQPNLWHGKLESGELQTVLRRIQAIPDGGPH